MPATNLNDVIERIHRLKNESKSDHSDSCNGQNGLSEVRKQSERLMNRRTAAAAAAASAASAVNRPCKECESLGEMNRRRASRLAKRFQPTKNGNSDEIPSTAPSNDPHLSHLESLEFFAAHFRQKRIALGYTQQQVGDTLGRRYNSYFSQTTISRFEDLNLSVRNMSKLRPLIEQWIADTESAAAKGASIADEQNQDDQQQQQQQTANGNGATIRRRRKRTTIDNRMRSFLESVFKVTPRPNSKQIEELATELSLKAEVVRVWFCNRRQRETRSGNTSVCESVSNCDVTLTSPPVLNPYFAANSLRGAAAVKADETVSNEKKVKRDETDEKKKKVAVWSEPV